MPDNQAEKAPNLKMQNEAKIERQFLKGTKDEDLGIYCDLFSARSSIKGQDGGVVTALLTKGLHEGTFDAAIVVRFTDGYTAEAVVAETAEDVLTAKGTKYLKVNVTKKMRELINQGKKRIAVVCTPCEVSKARKIQQTTGKDCEITIIGLFCFEAFNKDRLREEMKTHLGVDLNSVEKMQVQQGKFTAQVEGRAVSCRVKDLDCASEKTCRFCDDFTSRLADVSVGSVGSKLGYFTVVVRSEVGEKLVKNLEAAKDTVDKPEVAKLAKFKKARAEKSFASLNKS